MFWKPIERGGPEGEADTGSIVADRWQWVLDLRTNFILAQWQEGKVLIVLLVEFNGAATEDQREEGDTCEVTKPFVHYAHLHRSDQGRNRCVLCDG
jgi:hypothetical protein